MVEIISRHAHDCKRKIKVCANSPFRKGGDTQRPERYSKMGFLKRRRAAVTIKRFSTLNRIFTLFKNLRCPLIRVHFRHMNFFILFFSLFMVALVVFFALFPVSLHSRNATTKSTGTKRRKGEELYYDDPEL